MLLALDLSGPGIGTISQLDIYTYQVIRIDIFQIHKLKFGAGLSIMVATAIHAYIEHAEAELLVKIRYRI